MMERPDEPFRDRVDSTRFGGEGAEPETSVTTWMTSEAPTALRDALPECVDASKLAGREVQVTVRTSPSGTTLSVTDEDGAWVIAYFGDPTGASLALAHGVEAKVAMSQRGNPGEPRGPLTMGTAKLSCLVDEHERARIGAEGRAWWMCFLFRAGPNVAWAIVDDRIAR